MVCEAREDLPGCIYIRFRTDGSLFNLRRRLARTKTIEELITELLFANVRALLSHTEEALQQIVNCFSDAAKNFDPIHQPEEDRDVVPTRSKSNVQSSSDQHRWHQNERCGTPYLPG